MNRPTTRQSLMRRYKWENLTEAEKSAVVDAATIAATRAGIGLGVVLTSSALLGNGTCRHRLSGFAFVQDNGVK